MEQDISRFLKNDLGLAYMCEADVGGLMYHPRHGTLCRNFLKFIYQSTLCAQKYPDVYAQEEYTSAKEADEKASQELRKSMEQLEERLHNKDNRERHLDYLEAKFEYLERLKALQENSLKLLNEIENRPNEAIDQVKYRIEQVDYLDTNELHSLYSIERGDLLKNDDNCNLIDATNRTLGKHHGLTCEQNGTDERLTNLLGDVDQLHRAIYKILGGLTETPNRNQGGFICGVQSVKSCIHNLVALRVPGDGEYEEEIVNMEAKRLMDENSAMTELIIALNQEIIKAKDKHNETKSNMIQKYNVEMDKLNQFVDKVNELENQVKGLDE